VPIEANEAIDQSVSVKKRNPLWVHHPSQASGRKALLERNHSGQRVNDIPHRTEPNYQDFSQPRSLTFVEKSVSMDYGVRMRSASSATRFAETRVIQR
jgi:hypothetical protein